MRLLFAATAATIALAGAASANAPRTQAENRMMPFDAQLPACNDPGVIGHIQSSFKDRETEFWNSKLEVTHIDRVRSTSFRPNGKDLIPRRYCAARVKTSDGRFRTLEYNLTEDGGFSGWHGSILGLVRFATPSSYSVEWCMSGLDRHRTYAQDCRMARP
ncbi:MAG: hypothetical protein ACRCWF_16930 [Beijerinckiaceae bacterium]